MPKWQWKYFSCSIIAITESYNQIAHTLLVPFRVRNYFVVGLENLEVVVIKGKDLIFLVVERSKFAKHYNKIK